MYLSEESMFAENRLKSGLFAVARPILVLGIAAGALISGGCEMDSYFDPSRTGYFEHTPTTIPILERLAVIEEEEDLWQNTTDVLPADLEPSELSYRLSPGDVVTVDIFELYAQGVSSISSRRIDAGGTFRVPEIGDMVAAGRTAQEFEDAIAARLEAEVMPNPQVDVVVEEGSGFKYVVYGAVPTPGVYTLRDPDQRLINVLAQAGGVPSSTERVYVIRQVPLSERVKPSFDPSRRGEPSRPTPPANQPPPMDIEDLIDELEDDGGVSPGMLSMQDSKPPIDIDELEPVRDTPPPQVDVDDFPGRPESTGGETWIFVPERGEWVRSRSTTIPSQGPDGTEVAAPGEELILERVIEIPYAKLSRGDSSYNVVIRPDDRIYVEGAEQGVVYIDGEINRPGVYNLPPTGDLTLSRLVAAAGGLSGLAIPERVDLTRMVGDAREATVRMDLAAIRNRAEPDVFLKKNDHIIIGTNFWATPLAVVRNGFRATYGFGFLLDRNFGNDVFGAPPTNVGNN